MAYQTIQTNTDKGVLYLTLNRPESRNAMSMQMVDELLVALADAEQNEAVRVIVMCGAGGHFCSGGDLKDMAAARGKALSGGDDLAIRRINARFGELCAAFASSPLAIVAVLEGSVMGGGFGLACAVDVALADHKASFRLSETSLGLVPAQIAPYLVERLGYSQARRLAVTGGKIDGATALQIGLVHECHADTGAMRNAVERTVSDILACAPGALAQTKQLVRKARLADSATLIEEAASIFSKAALGKEGEEGIAAFVQKRKAKWIPL
jgi:isohexenylglutaconyl-CoA hydratase